MDLVFVTNHSFKGEVVMPLFQCVERYFFVIFSEAVSRHRGARGSSSVIRSDEVFFRQLSGGFGCVVSVCTLHTACEFGTNTE